MARKPRQDQHGGVFHVFARGNEKGLIFRDDRDRQTYLRKLCETVERHKWRCLSYCLMPNHVHLLLDVPEPGLGAGMNVLQGGYARAFNARHDRVGHLFQGRYGSVRMETNAQLCAAAAYIARNPVDAGMCETPEEWPWSSYRATVRGGGPHWVATSRLLTAFGTDRNFAIRSYALLSSPQALSPPIHTTRA